MGRHVRDAYYRRVHPVIQMMAGFFATVISLGSAAYVRGENESSVSQTDPPPPVQADDPRLPFAGEIVMVPWIAPPPHAAPERPTRARATAVKAARVTRKVPAQRKLPTPLRTLRTARILTFLGAQVGKAYLWGGNGPSAYDCSGLSRAAYRKAGVHLPRTSEEQSRLGVRVALNSLRPGDLLFWGHPGEASHVAVYVGHGRYIAAQNRRVGVVRYPLSFFPPSYARRVL